MTNLEGIIQSLEAKLDALRSKIKNGEEHLAILKLALPDSKNITRAK